MLLRNDLRILATLPLLFVIDTVDGLSACLPRVLSELRPDDREAITLCDLQDMAQADFAQAKGLSLSAAKSRLQRARVKLRTQMSHACQVQINADARVADFVPRTPLGDYKPPSSYTTDSC